MSTDAEENSQGTDEDFYVFIGKFKHLKSLVLYSINTVHSVFDCERILQHCPNDLQKLGLDVGSRDSNRTSRTTSLSQEQLQVTYDYQIDPNFKELVIEYYTPQSALLKFMYLKHKFVALKVLRVAHKNVFLNSALSAGYRINLDVVKQFFEAYKRCSGTRHVTIRWRSDYNQGIEIRNNRYWYNGIIVTPFMELTIDQTPMRQNLTDRQVPVELLSILEYVGPHLDILDYSNSYLEYNDEMEGIRMEHDTYVINAILLSCSNLQTLNFSDIYLGRLERTEELNTSLQTIQFDGDNKFEDGFFETLSASVPDLRYSTITPKKDTNHMEYNEIVMPYTKFDELVVKVDDTRELSMFILKDDATVGEEAIVILTTKDDDDNEPT